MAYPLSQIWLLLCVCYILFGAILVTFTRSRSAVLALNFITVIFLSWMSLYIGIYGNFFDDIIRISQEIVAAHFMGASYLFGQYAGNPLVLILYSIASSLGDTRAISVISVSLTYGLFFIALYLFSNRRQIPSYIYLFSSFFILNALNYVTTAFNIRFTLAFAIIVLSIEIDQRLYNLFVVLLMQFCAISLHNGMVPIFCIYYISKFCKVSLYKKFSVLFVFWGVVASTVFPLLANSGNNVLSSFGNKGVSYFVEGNAFDQSINLSRWVIRFCYLLFIIALSCFVLLKTKTLKLEEKFFLGLTCFSFGAIPMGYTALARYCGLGIIVSIYIISVFLKAYLYQKNDSIFKLKGFDSHFLFIAVILITLFLIWVNWYSNMSQYYVDFNAIPFYSYQFR